MTWQNAAVYTTPRSYCHNQWSWFQREWKTCGEKGNAEKPDKLEQYLERRWAHCQFNNFQLLFHFFHVQPWVYSLMATGLRKGAPEKNCSVPKHPSGTQLPLYPTVGARCAPLPSSVGLELALALRLSPISSRQCRAASGQLLLAAGDFADNNVIPVSVTMRTYKNSLILAPISIKF